MNITAIVKTYRSEWLMLAFIAQMLASPLADSHPKVGGFLALSLFGLILLGFRSFASRKVVDFAILPLSALWLAARILEALSNSHAWYSKAAPAAGLALSCAILCAMHNRFRSVRTETGNLIAEAFISYLVIASTFSQLYSLLDRVFHNCFNQNIGASQSGTLLYFSMITLSSVGYGGILPINPYIRLIAALESMIGIFYIAVVVSRLVAASAKADRMKDR
jgi:Ion channel